MARYLTFQLYGALQSWGSCATGGIRPSHGVPTRSGLLGLVAAALGIRREEQERLQRLDDAYHMAVRIDAPGHVLLDYHTVQVPSAKAKRVFFSRREELLTKLDRFEKPNTVLSRREYLAEAFFTVCLWCEGEQPPHSLDELAQAFRKPQFSLYLGRRSCPPGLPLAPHVGEFGSASEALAAYRPDELLAGNKAFSASDVVRAVSDCPWPDDTRSGGASLVRDACSDHARRQFKERQEFEAFIPSGFVQNAEKGDSHVSE